MAFKPSRSFRSQLSVNGVIDNERTNPRNLDSIKLPSGLTISGDYTRFDQASADIRVDELIAFQEVCVHGTRVAKEETKTLKEYKKLMIALQSLAQQCYETESAAAEAEVTIRTLSHKLVHIKRQLASAHAADVEQVNVEFASFEHTLSEKLRDQTNTASRGTNYGASYRGAMANAKVAVLN